MSASIFQIIMLLPTTVLCICWLGLARRKYEDKYENILLGLKPGDYRYTELFPIGFELMEKIHFNMKSRRGRKRVKELSEIYGKKYAGYYYYISVGSKCAYGITILSVVFLLAVLADDVLALVLGAAVGALLLWYLEELINDKLEERREELLLDFPQVLSKLTLLVNSGLVLREAWKKVSYTGERVLYQEMRKTTEELANGIPEAEAYQNFANRCALKEIRKFSNMVTQNLQKGTSELTLYLKEMAEEMWEGKRNAVMQKAQNANSKLLAPTSIIFIGILVMVMVPMFTSM